MKSLLVLIYGPNGAGKTTIARALATKYRGLHFKLIFFQAWREESKGEGKGAGFM